jgi:hypothetical protein
MATATADFEDPVSPTEEDTRVERATRGISCRSVAKANALPC